MQPTKPVTEVLLKHKEQQSAQELAATLEKLRKNYEQKDNLHSCKEQNKLL